ncbi:unnamed protein product [Moneuplotes crassus]|uniref:Uncharacterized protein n=1 Tax=Euplotes crassus TaxID=5936 RepID=A0AAD1U5W8_EUPCR|nr:unnamed protein product [Moneuplotes crassus]
MSHSNSTDNAKAGSYSQIKTIVSTPLPFEVRKKMMSDKGYNRFGEIMNPKNPNWKVRDRNNLNTQDIDGAVPDAYGRLRKINGRDYININDIKGSQSGYKIDKFANKVHFSLQTKDVTEEGKKNYKKDYNPLEPNYVMYTKSRRRKMVIKDDEKTKPRKLFTPRTRRRNNNVNDIEGAQPKKRTWLRKINECSDDESRFNTGLPIQNHFTSRNKVSLSNIGRNITFDPSKMPERQAYSKVDTYTQRNSPSRRKNNILSNNNSLSRAERLTEGNSEERKRHAATRHNSNSPQRGTEKQQTSLPNLAVPKNRKEILEVENGWDSGKKSKKYSNLILNHNSAAKLSKNLGDLSQQESYNHSPAKVQNGKSRNVNQTVQYPENEDLNSHIRVTELLDRRPNRNHGLNQGKSMTNNKNSPVKNSAMPGYYEDSLKPSIRREKPSSSFTTDNKEFHSFSNKKDNVRKFLKRNLADRRENISTNIVLSKEDQLNQIIKNRMKEGSMHENPLNDFSPKNQALKRSLPYF